MEHAQLEQSAELCPCAQKMLGNGAAAVISDSNRLVRKTKPEGQRKTSVLVCSSHNTKHPNYIINKYS